MQFHVFIAATNLFKQHACINIIIIMMHDHDACIYIANYNTIVIHACIHIAIQLAQARSHAETSTGGSFGQNVDLFGKIVDLFYKIVDLLNEIEDILVKSWLLKQNSGPPF